MDRDAPGGVAKSRVITPRSQSFNRKWRTFDGPLVIGIMDSSAALSGPVGHCDLLEWRADRLGDRVPHSEKSWIITARHPAEGGAGNLPVEKRRELFGRLLPFATFVDVEIRSLGLMSSVLADAKSRGVGIIASFHDFKKTPPLSVLKGKIRSAVEVGAGVVKIATTTNTPADVARLLGLFQNSPLPLAVMGMGKLGLASRYLFACCGSVLNYGWIASPNVPGQFSALELREIIDRHKTPRAKDRR